MILNFHTLFVCRDIENAQLRFEIFLPHYLYILFKNSNNIIFIKGMLKQHALNLKRIYLICFYFEDCSLYALIIILFSGSFTNRIEKLFFKMFY